MDTPPLGFLELTTSDRGWQAGLEPAETVTHARRVSGPVVHDPETLRRIAWGIGERRAGDQFVPTDNHVGLAVVAPYHGFAHWRVRDEWVGHVARERGDAWRDCRLVLRLYDVSYLTFNGFNAHRIQDHTVPALAGQYFFKLPKPGTWEIAEVGFLLRNGEFLPAARSQAVKFPPDRVCPRGDHAALLVDGRGRREEIHNLWEQEQILRERRRPKLRKRLRIAAFAPEALATGQESNLAQFVSELAAGQAAQGHDVHVFLPATLAFDNPIQADGVEYHPLDVPPSESPLELARAFGLAADRVLDDLPAFDLIHLHEWLTGVSLAAGGRPTVLSLSSVEAIRRNNAPATELSWAIEQAEREVAHAADQVLTPGWLRDRALTELNLEGDRIHAFPMEGRLANEWEWPLDYGQVKKEIGFGPLDRLILFVGPLEHAAGVDLLVEAMPVVLQRCPSARLAFAGSGAMQGHLQQRVGQLGVGHAVHLLGHVDGERVKRLVRSAEALVLPSRCRVPFDDAVVDLARRSGRPVVTTHGGPAHLVRHGENGLITYDNPGSMVWALDRILSDPSHTEQMGQNGRRQDGVAPRWCEVAHRYLEFCAARFPELTEMQL